MKITRHHLDQAAEAGIITPAQAEALERFLAAQPGVGPALTFTHTLYYLGGMIAIGAMTLFMTLGWESFGGFGIFWCALAYFGIGLWLSERFARQGLAIPAGICATFAVALVPLGVFGLQQGLGWWEGDDHYREFHRYIQWNWIYMELATLAAGAVIAWRYRYPFLLMPIAVTLWYLSMDLVPFINEGDYDWELRSLVSLYFGLLMTGLAFWVDLRGHKAGDYAFWLYLFGVLTFWGGLSSQDSDSELGKFLYCCINLGLIGIGVVLLRRVFVVFGAIGVSLYLGHLADKVFADSWLFPIALSAIGLGIIWLGVLWQRHEAAVAERLRARLPLGLRELIESRSRT